MMMLGNGPVGYYKIIIITKRKRKGKAGEGGRDSEEDKNERKKERREEKPHITCALRW